MRAAILFAFTCLAPSGLWAAECADLSGSYVAPVKSGAQVVRLELKQSGCMSAALTFHEFEGYPFTETQIFDGKPRVIVDGPELKFVRTARIDALGIHITDEHIKREEGDLDESYTEYTKIFSPRSDQLVVKWERWDPAGALVGRGKTTYTRSN